MGETHLAATLREVERKHILVTLTLCEGNRTRAAEVLGISVRSLRNKLRDYAGTGFTVQMPKTGLRQSTIPMHVCVHGLDESRQENDSLFSRNDEVNPRVTHDSGAADSRARTTRR
jgi:hypothetical protein